MYERRVSATSIEEILAASGADKSRQEPTRADKSQFYHYFSNREDLLAEVLSTNSTKCSRSRTHSPSTPGWGNQESLQAWTLRHETGRGLRGRPLGSIISEELDHNENCAADADADPTALAEVTIAIAIGTAMRVVDYGLKTAPVPHSDSHTVTAVPSTSLPAAKVADR